MLDNNNNESINLSNLFLNYGKPFGYKQSSCTTIFVKDAKI